MLPMHVLYVMVACCLHGDKQYCPENEPNPSSNTKRYDLQMCSTAARQPELWQRRAACRVTLKQQTFLSVLNILTLRAMFRLFASLVSGGFVLD